MYRIRANALEVLLVHPGGPFWARKDAGAWSIPKGEVGGGEELLEAAKREFFEELGLEAEGPFQSLGSVKKKGGKVVHAWAFEGDCDPTHCHCSTSVEIEWPPRSGKTISFPEIDRAVFFSIEEAKRKLNPAQLELLQRLSALNSTH